MSADDPAQVPATIFEDSESPTEWFRRLIQLDEAERRKLMASLIEQEYALSDDALRAFTKARLRSWLSIADMGGDALILGKTYDDVFASLPADIALRRAMVVQSVVIEHFSEAEIVRLLEIVPGMRRHLPDSSTRNFELGPAEQDSE